MIRQKIGFFYYLNVEEYKPKISKVSYRTFKYVKYVSVINRIVKIINNRYNINIDKNHIEDYLFKYGFIQINHFRFII
jgi:hypothetical protein